MTDRTPQELMLLFRQGDEDAFRELVRRFREPITSFALRMLNDQEKAVDVSQETFINVFTHAEGYRPMASFTSWLYRIAYNLAINEIRRQRRQPTVSLDATSAHHGSHGSHGPHGDAAGSPLRFEPRDAGLSAEEEMLGRERQEAVRRCVASLPPKYRGAIVMKDMEGLTFDEIANILDCPESTVKSRVMRARRMVLKRLEPYLKPQSWDGEPARYPQPVRQNTRS